MSRDVFERMFSPIDVSVGCSIPPENHDETIPYFVSTNGYSPKRDARTAMWSLIAERRGTFAAAFSGMRYERIGIFRPSSAVYVSSTTV